MKNWIYLFLLIFTKILLFIYSKSCFEFSCEDCISEEYGKCTKCKESFRLINGTCPCQRSSCALCIDNINNTCFLCKNGNYRWAFTCECNIRNCIECVGNKCLKCYNDYYYNETLNKCVFKKKENNNNNCCDKNCEICEDELKNVEELNVIYIKMVNIFVMTVYIVLKIIYMMKITVKIKNYVILMDVKFV